MVTLAKREQTCIYLKGRTLDIKNHTVVMGILNVTPDSFSDGGHFNRVDRAVQHAIDMIKDGAEIIDIGGESTRPGHNPVSLEEELERVLPVIEAIRKVSDIPISVDTYKAETARQALEAGADIINDIWGAKADPKMAAVAAEYQVPIILMHNRHDMNYNDIISDMKADLKESVDLVKNAGVKDENIIVDPGIGFAKTYEDNLKVMNHLEEFHSLGYPILLATSRKRFIGQALDALVDDRMEGTGATVCLGIAKGCQMVRVHDVKPIVKMTRMMDAMINAG
ncbi:MAG: dihydropteroate synthase [Tuberibacillus sp.]